MLQAGQHTWSGGGGLLAFPPAAGVDGIFIVVILFLIRAVDLENKSVMHIRHVSARHPHHTSGWSSSALSMDCQQE